MFGRRSQTQNVKGYIFSLISGREENRKEMEKESRENRKKTKYSRERE